MSSTTPTEPTATATATADPSAALKVAIMFVKQYYKCLSSHPDMLKNFYSPKEHHDSYLSHGEGSEPTEPSPLDSANHGHDRWGCEDNEKMLFEFEDGAIDAQPSQNEGILMVVTASVIFTSKAGDERRKTFVQTFFLAKIGRNFAVTNDILRFLAAKEPEVVEPTASVVVEPTVVEEPSVETPTEAKDEKKPRVVTEDESSAPGGGVEETKEEAPEEEEAPSTETKKRSSSKDKKKNKSKQQQQQQQPAQAPVSKPAPGSWASLVVSGGSAPNTPSRAAPTEKKPNPKTGKQPPLPPSEDKPITETNNNNNNNNKSEKDAPKPKNNDKQNNKNQKERTKRDPDNTLVIKNLSDNIKEQDILNMFQPFAAMTKTKIVGTNLNHHRLLAFVDYDSVAPVMAALKKHKETPFQWNGKVLEVDQKTQEQKARRKANNQNNNNNNNNQNNNNNNGQARNNNTKTNGRGDGGGGGRRKGTRASR